MHLRQLVSPEEGQGSQQGDERAGLSIAETQRLVERIVCLVRDQSDVNRGIAPAEDDCAGPELNCLLDAEAPRHEAGMLKAELTASIQDKLLRRDDHGNSVSVVCFRFQLVVDGTSPSCSPRLTNHDPYRQHPRTSLILRLVRVPFIKASITKRCDYNLGVLG